MVVSDSQGEKLRYTQGLDGATWEVTDHWSSIHKQHTSTHYATAPEISSDFVDLEIKLKLTWEIVLSLDFLPFRPYRCNERRKKIN